MKLQVREIFPSIQGEGPFSGEPAIFIRLAGCNLRCPFCDTDHKSISLYFSQPELANYVLGLIENKYQNINLVVITGGEPFLQNFVELVTCLLYRVDLKIQIETNGSIDGPWDFPWNDVTVVVSPNYGIFNNF